MRAEVYREKGRQYCEAARSMGASHFRIVFFFHLLPNSLVPLVSALPFQIVAGIGTLSSLDYLGYGLPVPTPSWGELLQQGQTTFYYLQPCSAFFICFYRRIFARGNPITISNIYTIRVFYFRNFCCIY